MKLKTLKCCYDGGLSFLLFGFALLIFNCASVSAAEVLAGIAENGRIVLFSSDDPENVDVMQVEGLQRGEKILGLDVRPKTGRLYALGSTSQIYVGSFNDDKVNFTAVGAPFATTLMGTAFGFDFNPVADRIRIVSDAGQNLRVNPDTGTVLAMDGLLNYAAGDSGAGIMPNVVAAAYTNNDNDPATGTTLYDIDVKRDTLVIQNPPNSGTLTTVGSLGVEATSVVGFDIAGSDGTAYASLVVNTEKNPKSARAVLFVIDLATGVAIPLGKIGGPKPLTCLTVLGFCP